jgi:hypothetical protein
MKVKPKQETHGAVAEREGRLAVAVMEVQP